MLSLKDIIMKVIRTKREVFYLPFDVSKRSPGASDAT
jgi:hypothetical protein